MRPGRFAARVVLVAAVTWWAPTLLLSVGALIADRVRFRLVLAWADVLRALGRRDAARQALEAALRRCEARRRALAARWSR